MKSSSHKHFFNFNSFKTNVLGKYIKVSSFSPEGGMCVVCMYFILIWRKPSSTNRSLSKAKGVANLKVSRRAAGKGEGG